MSSSLFIEILATDRSASSDAGDVARAILRHLVQQHYETDIVDEQYWDSTKDFRSTVFKVISTSLENLQENLEKPLQLNRWPQVDVLILMCCDGEAHDLKTEELVIEPITPTMYVESRMACRTNSGIVVTHLPTGISARCTGHRSRIHNQADALTMLSAKLRGLTPQVQR